MLAGIGDVRHFLRLVLVHSIGVVGSLRGGTTKGRRRGTTVLGLLVHLRMSFSLVGSGEFPSTSRTLKWFLSCVCSYVCSEMVRSREGAMTNVALEWLRSRVNSHVPRQFIGSREPLIAVRHGADVGAFPRRKHSPSPDQTLRLSQLTMHPSEILGIVQVDALEFEVVPLIHSTIVDFNVEVVDGFLFRDHEARRRFEFRQRSFE